MERQSSLKVKLHQFLTFSMQSPLTSDVSLLFGKLKKVKKKRLSVLISLQMVQIIQVDSNLFSQTILRSSELAHFAVQTRVELMLDLLVLASWPTKI